MSNPEEVGLLHGKRVKVGDKLWSFLCGWVYVINCNWTVRDYPIACVKDPSTPYPEYLFTAKGEADRGSGICCLFWSEATLVPPAPPKNDPITRWKWVVELDSGDHYVPAPHYSEAEAHEEFSGCPHEKISMTERIDEE